MAAPVLLVLADKVRIKLEQIPLQGTDLNKAEHDDVPIPSWQVEGIPSCRPGRMN
jgi:hypothetical protein